MQILPITNQPKFNGKVVLKLGANSEYAYMPKTMRQKINEISTLLKDKDYDIFISRNKNNPDFFDIAANKTFEKAQKVKEYTVKIQSSIIQASLVDAAHDAIEMYEKFISKSIKG